MSRWHFSRDFFQVENSPMVTFVVYAIIHDDVALKYFQDLIDELAFLCL